MAYDNCVLALQIEFEMTMRGEAVIPADKVARRVDPREGLPWDTQTACLGGAVCENDGVVVL